LKICCLLPSGAEILYALGLADSIIGVSDLCDYPPEILQTKTVVSRSRVDPSVMSSEEVEAALTEILRRGESPYELLMLRYNGVHRGAEKDVFPFVPGSGPNPTIMTYPPTRWGHLLDPAKMPEGEEPVSARDCYRYSMSHPAIDMVLCGPANAEQMDQAIAAMERGPLEPDERERVERIGAYLYGQYAPAYPDQGDAEDVSAGLAAQ